MKPILALTTLALAGGLLASEAGPALAQADMGGFYGYADQGRFPPAYHRFGTHPDDRYRGYRQDYPGYGYQQPGYGYRQPGYGYPQGRRRGHAYGHDTPPQYQYWR